MPRDELEPVVPPRYHYRLQHAVAPDRRCELLQSLGGEGHARLLGIRRDLTERYLVDAGGRRRGRHRHGRGWRLTEQNVEPAAEPRPHHDATLATDRRSATPRRFEISCARSAYADAARELGS